MNFDFSPKAREWQTRLKDFMQENLYPIEEDHKIWVNNPVNAWKEYPGVEELKAKAQASGLWNLFLHKGYGEMSPGLTNLEYAPLAQEMGKLEFASEIFNCSAPDTGNMEVLAKYGTPAQQEKWLRPLMQGSIRSAFLMTEPQVASSDATNIETSITRDGDHYVISGRKWWSSGAMHPRCKLYIVMGKTDPSAARHEQQSMIIVPADSAGVKVVRPLTVFGYNDTPVGHAEIELNNVRVPVSNLLVGEGRGFEIAQGRLGPGRIHHCMRLIGCAERALELMCMRVTERRTFGKLLKDYSSLRQDIAQSRCDIEQARLLTLSTADKIDKHGTAAAKDLIAMIKIVTPKMTCAVVDRAMQAFGGMGLSSDTPLASYFAYARTIRLADGPDEVHMYQLGRNTVKQFIK